MKFKILLHFSMNTGSYHFTRSFKYCMINIIMTCMCNIHTIKLPPRLSSSRIFIKSFLSIKTRASFSLVSVISGQVAAKYWKILLVGLSVERLSNSQQVFLGTHSFIASVNQFAKTIDVPSKAKAISSRRPARREGACTLREVITSWTFLESVHSAKSK